MNISNFIPVVCARFIGILIFEKCLEESKSAFQSNYAEARFNYHPFDPLNRSIVEGECGIMVFTVPLMKDVLNTLGDMIVDIRVDSLNTFASVLEKESRDIFKSINYNCATSLKYFYICHKKGNIFDELTNTFENVETLELNMLPIEPFKSDEDQRLNQIFPNLKDLNIKQLNSNVWPFITGKFIHLNSFNVKYLEFNIHGSHIMEFIMENPQIERLKVLVEHSKQADVFCFRSSQTKATFLFILFNFFILFF